jgi:hypothetical protein
MNRKLKAGLVFRALCASLAVVAVTEESKAGQKNITSGWDSAAIQVDGKSGDWNGIPATFLPDQNAAVALSNNSKFIYLLFRTNDRRTARVIKLAGLSISLDPTGRKEQKFQIKFRGGPSREQLGRPPERDQDPRSDLSEEPPTANPGDQRPVFTCVIKDRISEKEIPANGDEGPAAAFDTSLGFFTYEFRIPITGDSVRYYGIDSRPGSAVSISLVWGDMSSIGPRREGDGMRIDMGGPGGPGGMGGPESPRGRGGPGGGGRESGRRPQPQKKQEVWLKTTLAQQQAK